MNKKILFIAPTPFFSDRGCHVRILEQAEALKKQGFDITIATYHFGKDIPGIKTERIIKIPWYKKKEAGPSYHKLYLDLLLIIKCIFLARKKKFGIIHAHLHEGVFIGYFTNLFLKIFKKNSPLVADIQGSLVKEMIDHVYLKNKIVKRIFYYIEKKILNMPNVILTSSVNAAKILKEDFKIKKRIIPVCDAVDTNAFKPGYDIKGLKKKLGIKKEKIVVYLGLLNKYQGLDVLIKSIKIVKEKYENVKFVIMGYPNIDKYEKIAEKLDITDKVIFTGRIDYKDAPKNLCIGDIAVSFKTSKTEANGKLYDYIACGLPCVVSDIPVNKEILGDIGTYAKVNDEKDSAEKILFLLKNQKEREILSKKSRKKALDYSWDNRVKAILKIYQQLKVIS